MGTVTLASERRPTDVRRPAIWRHKKQSVWKMYHLCCMVFFSALVRRKLKSGFAGRSTKAVGGPSAGICNSQTVSGARVSGFPGWLPGRKAIGVRQFFGNLKVTTVA